MQTYLGNAKVKTSYIQGKVSLKGKEEGIHKHIHPRGSHSWVYVQLSLCVIFRGVECLGYCCRPRRYVEASIGRSWNAVLYGLQGEASTDVFGLKFDQRPQHVCLLPEQCDHLLLPVPPVLAIPLHFVIDHYPPSPLLTLRSAGGSQDLLKHVFPCPLLPPPHLAQPLLWGGRRGPQGRICSC